MPPWSSSRSIGIKDRAAVSGWPRSRQPRRAMRSACPTRPPTVRSPFRRRADGKGGSRGRAGGEGGNEQAPDVWFGALWHPEDFFGNGERIEFVDPVAY